MKDGLAGHNGVIAFAGLDSRAAMTAFDAPSNGWLGAQWAPIRNPLVDTTACSDNRCSTALEGTFGVEADLSIRYAGCTVYDAPAVTFEVRSA